MHTPSHLPLTRGAAGCRWRRSACLAAWILVASPARAQTAPQPPASGPDATPTSLAALPEVTVTGHYSNGVGTSDTASQGVVRAARLADLPLLRPGEVLETIPGLVVTQHSGEGKANQYFLRGYNLDHGTDFATFVDGVPLNMPTHAHGQGYTDLNPLIPELVSSIDYRKGPYFAQDGDFASAGSARIHYVEAIDSGLAQVTLGGFGYRRALLAGSPSGAPVGDATRALAALELLEDDGPWAVAQRLRKLNGLARIGAGGYDRGWSLDAQVYANHWNATDQVPLALIESGQLGRYAALDPSDGGDAARAVVSGEWHRHDEQSYTKAFAYLAHSRLQLWSDFTYFELRAATGDQFEQAEQRNTLGAEIVQGWNHTWFGRESVTETGLQLRHDRIAVALRNSQQRVAFQTVSDDEVSQTQLALYAQNTTRWTAWLRTLLGGRVDQVQMALATGVTPANDGRARAAQGSPKVSLILGPWQHSEFFVNAGRGFHSNDARGVIDRVDPTTGGAATPVAALAASRGAELGVRSDALPGLQSGLALWRLDSDSELTYNADSTIGSTSPEGASRRYGVEWNNHLVAADWLLIDADLSWIHARYAHENDNGQRGDAIPNAVARVASLGATLQHLGPWSVGWATRYIGAYPLSQDGTLRAPASVVTNLKVQRRLSAQASISLDVLNLFDRRYDDIEYAQDYRVAPSAPVVAQGISVHPGEPRQFRLTAQLHW